jgi:hypothetical protein
MEDREKKRASRSPVLFFCNELLLLYCNVAAMQTSKNLSRASELEHENSELCRKIESLLQNKTKVQQENEILQSTLKELQARLIARRMNVNEPFTETNMFPAILTDRQIIRPRFPSKRTTDILETQLRAALPNLGEQSKQDKHGYTQHGPQSSIVEKLLRKHKKIVQPNDGVNRVLSAVRSDRLWFKKKSASNLTNSLISEGEYDLDGRLLSNVNPNDPTYYSHCSVSNLVHMQQEERSSRLMEISGSNRQMVFESMAKEIEKSYPKRGQVAEKISERADSPYDVDAQMLPSSNDTAEFNSAVSAPHSREEEADSAE